MQSSKTMRAISALETSIFPSSVIRELYQGAVGAAVCEAGREQAHAFPTTDIPTAGADWERLGRISLSPLKWESKAKLLQSL